MKISDETNDSALRSARECQGSPAEAANCLKQHHSKALPSEAAARQPDMLTIDWQAATKQNQQIARRESNSYLAEIGRSSGLDEESMLRIEEIIQNRVGNAYLSIL